MLVQARDSKINKDSFLVMVDHDVIWLNIPVENFDNIVAVVYSFEHISKVVFQLGELQTDIFTVLRSSFLNAKLVVLFEPLVS
jgi:hypothetical protein